MSTPDLTDVRLAIENIVGNGCDCGTDEPGTCMACLCSSAILGLQQREAALRAALQAAVDRLHRRAEWARKHRPPHAVGCYCDGADGAGKGVCGRALDAAAFTQAAALGVTPKENP